MWSKLRANPDETIPFSVLQKAVLWSDKDLYDEPVWTWLTKEGGEDLTLGILKSIDDRREGSAHPIAVEIGDRSAKLFWGSVGAMLKQRGFLDVVLVELVVGCTELPAALLLERAGAAFRFVSQSGGRMGALWGSILNHVRIRLCGTGCQATARTGQMQCGRSCTEGNRRQGSGCWCGGRKRAWRQCSGSWNPSSQQRGCSEATGKNCFTPSLQRTHQGAPEMQAQRQCIAWLSLQVQDR